MSSPRTLGGVPVSMGAKGRRRDCGTGTGRGWIRSANRGGVLGGQTFGYPHPTVVKHQSHARGSGPVIGAGK
jgi:hypothetical protein